MPHRRHRTLTGLVVPPLFALLAVSLAAQEPLKILDVRPIVTAPPKIDGLIDDACWKAIKPVDDFYPARSHQRRQGLRGDVRLGRLRPGLSLFRLPHEGFPARKIWAELTPRNEYENNDSIKLILDAYNDKRTSIEFEVNPRGVQKNSVETIWKSEAVIRPDGWSAEMAIPFKSLRFSAKKLDVWGVNFERYINRLNETDFWTDVKRDLPELQQSGELRGLAGLRPGYNLEFFPYAGVRTSDSMSRAGARRTTKAAVGLDAKWGIKPNLYLDVTASPDFSEVESDPFIFQLSPYENYFQENRPFFTEGSRYFTLGEQRRIPRGRREPVLLPPHPQSPGRGQDLGQDGRASASASSGPSTRSMSSAGEDPRDSYFGVFRVQKDILKNSQVGVYYAGRVRDRRTPATRTSPSTSISISRTSTTSRAWAPSPSTRACRTPATASTSSTSNGSRTRACSSWRGFQRIEDNVNISTGYIDQKDIQSFDLMVGHAWRYSKGLFKRFSFDFSGAARQDSFGNATGQSGEFFIWSELFNRIEVHGGVQVGRSKYQVLDVTDELVWTPDYIKTWGGNIDFSWDRGGFLKEISVEAGWDKRGVYNEEFTAVVPGAETNIEGQLVLRPRSNLEWSVQGGWIRQTVGQHRGGGLQRPGLRNGPPLPAHPEPLPQHALLRRDPGEPVQPRFPRRLLFRGREHRPARAQEERAQRAPRPGRAATPSLSRSPTCSGSDPPPGR